MRRGREMKPSVKRRAKNCIRGAVLLACFIAVWYVASCFTQPLFIPAPTKRTCLLFPADYWRVCSFYAGSNSPLPSNLWREAYQGNYHAGCFLLTVCSRNRIFSAPDPMVWDWGADENFVPIYCNVCLLAAVDPALL